MDRPQRAVLFLEEDSSVPEHSKPLMLEAVVFCPILTWAGEQLLADGVQRFFVVCGPRFAAEARACLPEEADVTVSERQEDLMAFLNTPDPVLVLCRAALPAAQAGPGFAYAAPGYELQESWKERMTNQVTAAELVPGWLRFSDRIPLQSWSLCSGSGLSGSISAEACGFWIPMRFILIPGSPSVRARYCCPVRF